MTQPLKPRTGAWPWPCLWLLAAGCGAEATQTDAGFSAESTSTGGLGQTSGTATASTRGSAVETSQATTDRGDGGTSDGTRFDLGDGGAALGFPRDCAEARTLDTSVGCEFYPVNVPGADAFGVAVSNVSNTEATVTLRDIAGEYARRTVAAGAIEVLIYDGAPLTWRTAWGRSGLKVESDQPLQVFQISPSVPDVTADASIVLPAAALGTRHRVSTYVGDLGNPYIAVVGTESDTAVTLELVRSGQEILAGGMIPALDYDAAMTTHSLSIDELDTVVFGAGGLHSTSGALNDLTGALITSDKPVAVYSGSTAIYVPDPRCCADLITAAAPPTRVFGTEYAGVKYLPISTEGDVWRFVADVDGTEIELSGGVDATISLDAGEFHELDTRENFWARGSEPFGLVHFMTSGSRAAQDLPRPLQPHDCPGTLASPGDPTMGWAFPRGNWLSRYLLAVGPRDLNAPPPMFPEDPTDWCHDHITVVAPVDRWTEITLDGAPLPSARSLTPSMAFAYVPVANSAYELIAPDGVGVEVSVYGYVSHGSYAYPGGMGLQTLNPAG